LARHLPTNADENARRKGPLRGGILHIRADVAARFWPTLKDTQDGKLPSVITGGRVALVRVRAEDDQVPRPAGVGQWPVNGAPRKPGTMNTLLWLVDADWAGALFYGACG